MVASPSRLPSPVHPVKRLSIEVSDALHQQARLLALADGQTLTSLVIQLLNDHLAARSRVTAHPRRRLSDYVDPSPAGRSSPVSLRR